MTGPVYKVVLVPRFTSLAGARTFHTSALNVRKFAEATFYAWRAIASGGNLSSLQISVEESADLTLWRPTGTVLAPGEGEEMSASYFFDLDWMRLAIQVVPTSPPPASAPKVTCWAVGNFVGRETERVTQQ